MHSKLTFIFLLLLTFNCAAFAQDGPATLVAHLPVILHETSSLINAKSGFWTMNDGPSTVLYRIDENTGVILQQVNILNQKTEDTEALTQDDDYIYIGDVGNNHAPRSSGTILKIKKSTITDAATQYVSADAITFTYDGFNSVDFNHSTSSFDCEAMLSYKSKLYLFTKRRIDNQTVLYELSKRPGRQISKRLATFNSEGVITDAAINANGTEIALVGYQLPGHKAPFVWKLRGFSKNKFFSGRQQRINISTNNLSWQTEAIVYKSNNALYLSCEQTSDIGCSLYKIVE